MPRVVRAALGALLISLCGASFAQATPGPDYYGANIQPMVKLQVVPPDRWDGYVAQMAADGLRVARADAAWSWAEPKAPVDGQHTYEWDPAGRPLQSLDRLALLLARHGVRLLPVLATAPGWVRGPGVDMTPEHYADFAAFAGAYAARYGTGGSFWREHPEMAPVPVTDYEIWTEANSANFWTHRPDPVEYARALGPVSTAIHQADPAGRVLASIGWQGFESYMAGFYAAGTRGTFDAVGFHPYAPHATAIVDLVKRMRRVLAAAGDGQMPIDVTETGQPRALTGPGSARAGSGLVSDRARAATHAFAGDALARSDCGVGDYLLYANVASETDAEPGGEGYMGIYNVGSATPNLTGAAIRDASLRWRAAPRGGLGLCSGTPTAPGNLLPLELSVTHDSPTCVTGQTNYGGNPLESAQLTLRTADGRVSRAEVDAFGAARVCIPNGPPIYRFDVTSEVTNAAVSATWHCEVLGGQCSMTRPAPGNGATPGSGSSTAPRGVAGCRVKLRVRFQRITRRRSTVRAQLTCTGRRLPSARFKVLVQRRGDKKRRTLRRVTLRRGRSATFTLRTRLRQGDRVWLERGPDERLGTKKLQARATATRRRGARR